MEWQQTHGGISKFSIGKSHQYIISDLKLLEHITTSNEFLTKSPFYQFLHSWLGLGLLTSTGEKWKSHRKVITPTFHFKILEQFIPIFDKTGRVLISKLEKVVDEERVDIYPFITLCTLDVICETAMGVSIDAQTNSNSEYVNSVRFLLNNMMERTYSFIGQTDLYFLTSNYWKERKCLKVVHGLTESVIRSRKEELLKCGKDKGQEDLRKEDGQNDVKMDKYQKDEQHQKDIQNQKDVQQQKNVQQEKDVQQQNDVQNQKDQEDIITIGGKKKMAFLDMLIQARVDGKPLTDLEIREEVDTFMFEGHDTTASAISFSLYCLANHPEVQQKAVEELQAIFGKDKTRPATYNELQDMRYLEMVIKEVLRMYPAVPFVGRVVLKEFQYKKYTFVEGTPVTLFFYGAQMNPKNFKDPHKFDPDRFLDDSGRNLFSYLPFSAGPRNCIGKRFALLELKSLISKVLRNFELFPARPKQDLIMVNEGVLKSANGICIRLKNRF